MNDDRPGVLPNAADFPTPAFTTQISSITPGQDRSERTVFATCTEIVDRTWRTTDESCLLLAACAMVQYIVQ